MKFYVYNRYRGDLQFTADIECDDRAKNNVKLGLAIKWAVKSNANLTDADLTEADLRKADLRNANLTDAYLRGANLTTADLRSADLRNADLRNADLFDADLRSADLRSADLRGANLCGADLSRADLRNANLCNANLCAADLSRADLFGAVGVILFGPIGRDRRIGCSVKHIDGPMVRFGWSWGTLDETTAKIRDKYGENSAYENLVRAACAALD